MTFDGIVRKGSGRVDGVTEGKGQMTRVEGVKWDRMRARAYY